MSKKEELSKFLLLDIHVSFLSILYSLELLEIKIHIRGHLISNARVNCSFTCRHTKI